MEIYTFGSSEMMAQILDAIATMYKAKVLHGILRLSALSAFLYAFYSIWQKGDPSLLYQKFMQPLLLVIIVLNVPSVSVAVVDSFSPTEKTRIVDNVPFILAFPASVTSTIGKNFQRVVEQLLHTPNSEIYTQNGMIFGADSQYNMYDLQIRNPIIERNLARYCRNCIAYDTIFKLYTLEELKDSNDLFDLLEKKSSTGRSVEIQDSQGKERRKTLNCRVAAREIKEQILTVEKPWYDKYIRKLFPGSEGDFSADDLTKYLPLTFRNIGQSQSSDEILLQQLGINGIYDQFNPEKFAKKRAEYLTQANAGILAGIGIQHLVGMKTVMQALLYFSLIFILGLMLVPGREGSILIWLGMVAWVDITWPPTYAILHYIMELVSNNYLDYLREVGLSISSFEDMMRYEGKLHGCISWVHTAAGVLSAYVPYLAISLFTGKNWVHLGSNLAGPMQTAANVAAGEMASGNYSFGNSSFNNQSMGNISDNQVNLAPSLRKGFNVLETAAWKREAGFGAGRVVMTEKQSNFAMAPQTGKDMIQEMSAHRSGLINTQEILNKNYNESMQSAVRDVEGFSDYLSNAENYQESLGVSEATDVQEAFSNLENEAQTISDSTGVSQSDIMKTLVAGAVTGKISSGNSGIGKVFSWVTGASVDASASVGMDQSWQTSHQNALSEIENYTQSEEYRENISKIQRVNDGWNQSLSSDSGMRSTTDISSSLDNCSSLQEQIAENQSQIESFSLAERTAETHRDSLTENLTQPMLNWSLNEGHFSSLEQAQDFFSCENRSLEKSKHVANFMANSGYIQRNFSEAKGEILSSKEGMEYQAKKNEFDASFGSGVRGGAEMVISQHQENLQNQQEIRISEEQNFQNRKEFIQQKVGEVKGYLGKNWENKTEYRNER